MAGVDVLGEPVGVDERRVRRDIAPDVVGGGDRGEQLHIGAQPATARLADGDRALGRSLGTGSGGRVRARDRKVDRRHRGQPLCRGHEGFGLVGVIGAFGLAQQCGDPGEHPVIGHGATLGDGDDITAMSGRPPGEPSPHRNSSTTTIVTPVTLVRYLPTNRSSAAVSCGDNGPLRA